MGGVEFAVAVEEVLEAVVADDVALADFVAQVVLIAALAVDELAEEARETQAEVVPVSVDIDNPDDLDAYFEYAFEQARKQAKTVETASFMTEGG